MQDTKQPQNRDYFLHLPLTRGKTDTDQTPTLNDNVFYFLFFIQALNDHVLTPKCQRGQKVSSRFFERGNLTLSGVN